MSPNITFNIADIIVIAILILSASISYKAGLIRSVLSLASLVFSYFITLRLYPAFARFLRSTPLYTRIMTAILENLGFDPATSPMQTLDFPEVLTNALFANNNPEAYSALGVTDLKDYIGAFLANNAVNIIAMIVIFILVQLLINIVCGFLNIFSMLPVINSFNKLGGFLIGILQGVFFIWVICTVLIFLPHTVTSVLLDNMQRGVVSGYLYNANPLLGLILTVIW